MANELTVQSLGDAVKDKVRKAMMDAIPDEALQGLIKAEFDRFFVDSKRFGYADEPSPFKVLVRKELENILREKVRKSLVTKFGEGQPHYQDMETKFMQDLVAEMAPHALRGVMSEIAYRCVENIKRSY